MAKKKMIWTAADDDKARSMPEYAVELARLDWSAVKAQNANLWAENKGLKMKMAAKAKRQKAAECN